MLSCTSSAAQKCSAGPHPITSPPPCARGAPQAGLFFSTFFLHVALCLARPAIFLLRIRAEGPAPPDPDPDPAAAKLVGIASSSRRWAAASDLSESAIPVSAALVQVRGGGAGLVSEEREGDTYHLIHHEAPPPHLSAKRY